ncbi:MAG: UPF0104 family protein [Xanthomonadaceae bacterium]|nr:UPF0104 family protein [Xanthomonadaceae bacterium]
MNATVERHTPWLRWGSSGLAAAILLGAAWLLHRYLHAMRWRDFVAAWQALPARAVVGSATATCLSFAMLAAFEMQAARLGARGRVSLRRAAFAGVVSNAIGNMLGFHAITASAVRYRIYGAAGLGVGDTARIVGIAGLGVGLGFVVVITGALVWQPTIVAGWGRWPGLGLLLAMAAWLVWLGRSARTLRVAGWSLTFPDARAAALQMLIGAVEMCGAIAALHVLLPASVAPPFVDFLPVYVAAVLAGLVSHAPGGLGVFESILLAAFPHAQRPEVLAAILCYRLTYTVGPFVLGSLAFGAFEGRLRWRSRRAPTVAR